MAGRWKAVALASVLTFIALTWTTQHDLARAQQAGGDFDETPCPMQIPEGQDAANVLCGYLTVPENRDDPDSRTIRLAVAVLKSTSDDPEPDPVIYLSGGPGGPSLEGEMQGLGRADAAAFIQERRDYIFFDQRGTGLSEPGLYCPETRDLLIEDLALNRTEAEADANFRMRLLECRDRLLSDGVDLSAYNSAASAQDIADLAEALGYDEYNLFGTSYGTRLALTAMRDTPRNIRSVILDSTVPLQVDVDVETGRNFERALSRVVAGCKTDPECAARYPNLEADYWANVARANADPIEVTINDREGSPVQLSITGNTIISGTFVGLYSAPVIRVLPFANDLIARGEHIIVQVLAQQLVFAFSGFADAMTTSVNCSEEIRFITSSDLQRATAGVRPEVLATERIGTFSEPSLQAERALCETWIGTPPDPAEDRPVTSSIPALVLGGEYDPITPPHWGALAAQTLSNSHFFEFPAAGHGVLGHHFECASSMIAQYLEQPPRAPDAGCIDGIPPIDYAVDEAPAPPTPQPSPSPTPPPPSGVVRQIVAPDTGSGQPGDRRGDLWPGAAALGLAGIIAIGGGIVQRCRPRDRPR